VRRKNLYLAKLSLMPIGFHRPSAIVIGGFVFAISGGVHVMERKMDAFGILFLALAASGTGGAGAIDRAG
jgi:hypothetical protein